jgi:hypothetical protein
LFLHQLLIVGGQIGFHFRRMIVGIRQGIVNVGGPQGPLASRKDKNRCSPTIAFAQAAWIRTPETDEFIVTPIGTGP